MTTLDKTGIEAARNEFVHSTTKEQIERWAYKWADDLLSTAGALSFIPEQGVKPLEWVKRHSSEYLSRAETLLGVYRVWSHHEANGKWFWSLTNGTFAASDGPLNGTVESEDEAKAAAQADYEARIASALVAPSHPAAVGKDVNDADV